MSTTHECLTHVVGLSQTACECYDTPPADYAESLSGMYIDELMPLEVVNGLVNCANGSDLWELLERGRYNAIQQFKADALAGIMMFNEPARNAFKGAIGRTVTTQKLTMTSGNYCGLRLACADVKDGTLIINSVGAIFDKTGTLALNIYNNLGELVYGPFTIDTVAGVHTVTPVGPVSLPLHDDMTDNIEYFILYQYLNGGPVPYNNDIKCNCGKWKPAFDCRNPYWWGNPERGYGWAKWLMVGAYNSAAMDFDDCATTTSNYMYGLTLPSIELRCETANVLCFEDDDWDNEPVAAAIAFAIRYKAAALFAGDILRSPNLNRFVMLNHEQLTADIVAWDAQYKTYVDYIAKNIDVSVNDCLTCREFMGFSKSGIKA